MNYWLWMMFAGLGLVAILFFNRHFKIGLIVLRNIIIGVLGIFALNMVLTPIGLAVGVNLMTMFVVGVLGIPGFFLLYLTQWIAV